MGPAQVQQFLIIMKYMKAHDDLINASAALTQQGISATTIGYSGSALRS